MVLGEKIFFLQNISIFVNHTKVARPPPYLSMCSTGHVDPIDLNDLVPRLQSPIAGHQTIREDLLDDDTPQGGVRAAHDGDPQARAGPGYLHVRNLPLQYGEAGDACNEW